MLVITLSVSDSPVFAKLAQQSLKISHHQSHIHREADKSNEIDQRWGDFEKSGEAPATAAPEPKEGEPEAEQAPVEEEPKELTLDEWKAQRAGRQKPQFNIRKAGEGEDPSQWKKMYELNKKKDGNEEAVSFLFVVFWFFN